MGDNKPRAVLEFTKSRHMRATYSLSGQEVWVTWTPFSKASSQSVKPPKTSPKSAKRPKKDVSADSAFTNSPKVSPKGKNGRPAPYIIDPDTGKWQKINMNQLDYSRVCQEVEDACTEPQMDKDNFTRFALPIWMEKGGFELLSLKEIDESEPSTTPLKRRRHLEPNMEITPTKPKKSRADPQLTELSRDDVEAARMMFGDLTRTLTTAELTQIQNAEAMSHKKGWVPAADMLLRARAFAQRELVTPQECPEYELWKFPRSTSHDHEDAERARKRRRQKTGTINPPDLTWSTMEAVLDFTLERHEKSLASLMLQQKKMKKIDG